MGLLNFRKKSKKINTIIKDNLPKLIFENDGRNYTDSGISSDYYSPIPDSFMTESSISDITSSSLLDEILNELPSSRKNKKSSGSEKSSVSTRDICHSLNLKSNYGNSNSAVVADHYTKRDIVSIVPIDSNIVRIPAKEKLPKDPYANNVNGSATIATNLLKGQQPVYGVKRDMTINNVCSASSDDSESDSSLTAASFSSTKELVSLHPISRSEPQFNHSVITTAGKQEDLVPLIELIPSSYTASNNLNKAASKGGVSSSLNNAGSPPSIQISPGFAINRMKERHRQEYRRSLQWTPSVVQQKVSSARRSNSLINNYSSQSTLVQLNQQLQQPQQQYQQQQDLMASNQRVIVVPKINNTGPFNNNTSPKKSLSTTTNTNYRSINSPKVHSRPLIKMKPIQEEPLTAVSKATTTPQAVKKVCCYYNSIRNNQHQIPSLIAKFCCKHSHNCYTHQPCHARYVTQTQYFSGNDPSCIQVNSVTTENNKKDADMDCGQASEDHAVPFKQPADNIKHANLDGVFEKRMKMTPKLKIEYRRMQQIYRKKYYSVPNLLQLQDYEEVEESPKRGSLENDFNTDAADMTPPISNMSSEASAIVKNSVCIEANQENQNNNRKVIYSCHHRPHHEQVCHHHQDCYQSQRKVESLCSCHYRERQLHHRCCNYGHTHKPRIQQQKKPLLSLISLSELSDTTATGTQPQNFNHQ